MKVKVNKLKHQDLGFTEGKVYESLNVMNSASGGKWVEIRNDIGLVALVKAGAHDAFGTWEIVSE